MLNEVVTEVYVGGADGWVDASGGETGARQRSADSGGGHTITRAADSPGRMDLVLGNPDGRWTPRNPRSPYYGRFGRNTPVRAGIIRQRETFDVDRERGWGPGWGNFGGGDPHFDTDYRVVDGQGVHLLPVAPALRASVYEARLYVDAEIRTRVTVDRADIGGGNLEPANILFRRQPATGEYYMARVEVTPSEAVRISLHHSTAGVIAAAVTVAGLVYVGQSLDVAASCVGDRLAVKVWPAGAPEPRDWQLTATDTRIPGAGQIGVRSGVAAGNTNEKPLRFAYDHVTVIDRRAVMELAEPSPDGDAAGADAWLSVSAAGITRRLGQGAKPLDSALTRRIPATSPRLWWPLEDGRDATAAASGIPGQPGLWTADPAAAGFGGDGPPGAAGGLAPRNGPVAALTAPVPSSAAITPDSFTASLWIRGSADDTQQTSIAMPLAWAAGGDEQWEVFAYRMDPANLHRVVLQRYSDYGGSPKSLTVDGVQLLDGQWHLLSLGLQQQGADIAAWLYVDGVQRGATFITGETLHAPATVTVLPGPAVNLADYAISHVQFHNGPFAPDEMTAGRGYAGERAADRFARLCAEQGVPVFITRGPDLTQRMGPQRPEKFLTLLQECVDVDGGIMGEAREHLALTFTTAGALYNRPAVQLTYAHLAPPFRAVPDDKATRNDVTAARPGGSKVRMVADTGPLSVQPPPDGVGVYDASVTVNVADDAQLIDAAGWRVHVGTWDEPRYPAARVNLAARVWRGQDQLTDEVAALDAGRVLEVDQLPDWMPPGPVALQVRGSVEQIDQHTRIIDFDLQPAGPYTVATADGEPRAAGDGTALVAPVSSTGAVLLAAAPYAIGPWTEDPADVPLPVRVGGERVTVGHIGPGALDTFERTSTGWGADHNGTPWTHTGGTVPGDYPVTGGTARHVHGQTGVLRHSFIAPGGDRAFSLRFDTMLPVVAGGAPVTVWGAVRAVDAQTYYAAQFVFGPGAAATVGVQRRIAGNLTSGFGGAFVPLGNYAASQWWRVEVEINGGDVLRVRAWPRDTAPMPDWHKIISDPGAIPSGTLVGILSRVEAGNTNGLPLSVHVDNVRVATPQRFSITARGVNGVQRQWPAGTDVQVWLPGVAPL